MTTEATEETIFDGKYFRLTTQQKDELLIERVYGRPGVTIFPITKEGNVRFVRKSDAQNDEVRETPVSAYCDDGEDPLTCAKRELAEELGLTASRWTLMHEAVETGSYKKTQTFFVAEGLKPAETDLNNDIHESIDGFIDLSAQELDYRLGRDEYGFASKAYAIYKLLLKYV